MTRLGYLVYGLLSDDDEELINARSLIYLSKSYISKSNYLKIQLAFLFLILSHSLFAYLPLDSYEALCF